MTLEQYRNSSQMATGGAARRAFRFPRVILFLCGLAFLPVAYFSLGVAQSRREPADASTTVPAETLTFTECEILPSVARPGRSAFHQDPVESQIVAGTWKAPKPGYTVTLASGSVRKWERVKADKDGGFGRAGLNGGYAYFAVPAKQTSIMLLEASGHIMVYVNGEPHTGDTYGYGYVRLPVLLKEGTNDLLFQLGRGKLKVKLIRPRAGALLDTSDSTLPDLVVGEQVKTCAALVLINATTQRLDDLSIQTTLGGNHAVLTQVPSIPPLSTHKAGFQMVGPALQAEGSCSVNVKLLRHEGEKQELLDTASLNLRVLRPEQTRKCTFVSEIDGSVQYYGLVPAKSPGEAGAKRENTANRPGLVLSLHGAGVEGIGQASCYAPKTWVNVVAPTNRRPYGFDWEDWGRLDALEVLELAQKRLSTDPQRTYLTGHSMGGHGTWHIGVTYPDRFAAIGPSAGWVSMWSYAGMRRPEQPDALQEILLRAAQASDTLALVHNLDHEGVYILHGDKDTNVPVQQARTMRQELGSFHPDLVYYEQPGAEHWWGNACVDWPPMIDFFSRHTIPALDKVTRVDFQAASPGVSARCRWATIESQLHAFRLSSIHLSHDPGKRSFAGKTENVARLALDIAHLVPGKPIEIHLDGQILPALAWPDAEHRIWLTQTAGKWSVTGPPSPHLKGPARYGSFKDAFRHHALLLVGTHGTPEENAWASAKARFDAETFWYRGNGALEIVTDQSFDPEKTRDRNVVLYGNADTNSAWKTLLAESPVQVHRGRVQCGTHAEEGTDLACAFIRPRPGSDLASVGVVSGTGLNGMRLIDRWPYFMSGVAYPDLVVTSSETLTKGNAGIRFAGFFGPDWSMESGDFEPRNPPAKRGGAETGSRPE
ncbi:MAG TPA: prolyl oligopeptidase family serine peptidase [Gemmataceae bacterium]|nr:prolyl oligopeptidase family serine peptidase [Gemmataceae bacterium]